MVWDARDGPPVPATEPSRRPEASRRYVDLESASRQSSFGLHHGTGVWAAPSQMGPSRQASSKGSKFMARSYDVAGAACIQTTKPRDHLACFFAGLSR